MTSDTVLSMDKSGVGLKRTSLRHALWKFGLLCIPVHLHFLARTITTHSYDVLISFTLLLVMRDKVKEPARDAEGRHCGHHRQADRRNRIGYRSILCSVSYGTCATLHEHSATSDSRVNSHRPLHSAAVLPHAAFAGSGMKSTLNSLVLTPLRIHTHTSDFCTYTKPPHPIPNLKIYSIHFPFGTFPRRFSNTQRVKVIGR